MELLLWLYLYDDRWFFNLKLPTKIYKFLWLLPIFTHFMLLSAGVYYLNFVDDFQCAKSLKMWIYHRTFFSILMIINIIIFMMKIQTLLEKEKVHINNSTKIFNYHPENHLNSLSFDQIYLSFWVRRNALVSTSGILLLIQGLISIYYSYMIKNLITSQYFRSCDYKIQKALSLHSYSIYYTNNLLLSIIFIMLAIKIFHFVMGMYFPRKYAVFMKALAKIYKNKFFKLNFLEKLALIKRKENKSIEMQIIKDNVNYNKISLENENFMYTNQNSIDSQHVKNTPNPKNLNTYINNNQIKNGEIINYENINANKYSL